MNEKLCVILVFFVFFFSSCCTRRDLYHNGNGANEVRKHIGELGETTTAAAIRNTELEGKINSSLAGLRGGLDDVGRVEESIGEGRGDVEEFKEILRRIRRRRAKKTQQSKRRKP